MFHRIIGCPELEGFRTTTLIFLFVAGNILALFFFFLNISCTMHFSSFGPRPHVGFVLECDIVFFKRTRIAASVFLVMMWLFV